MGGNYHALSILCILPDGSDDGLLNEGGPLSEVSGPVPLEKHRMVAAKKNLDLWIQGTRSWNRTHGYDYGYEIQGALFAAAFTDIQCVSSASL